MTPRYAHLDDTISAISTAMGRSGIGIVRLSGPQSLSICQELFHPMGHSPPTPNQARFGTVRHPQSGEVIDEAVAIFYQAPRSYTGEDMVELSCHGNPLILSCLLDLTKELGARTARPGEFTLRAFFNGRIDLTQAEAVRDLIEAQTTHQAKIAVRQLQGSLSRQLHPLKDQLREMIVHLETAVEFVDDDLNPDAPDFISCKIKGLLGELERIEHSFAAGRVVREGIRLAIVGRPNVGKSSIFNRLLKLDRAIVTNIPGTTRDTLSHPISFKGIPAHLVDTAGICQSTDVVETLGIERSRTAMAEADIILVVLDGSEGVTNDDAALLSETRPMSRVVVVNKIDLPQKLLPSQIQCITSSSAWVRVSALTGEGINGLRDKVVEIVTSGRSLGFEDVILTNSRHHELIVGAIGAMNEAQGALNEGQSEEVILVGLYDGMRMLDEITGETTVEDILDQIFSTFCVGK